MYCVIVHVDSFDVSKSRRITTSNEFMVKDDELTTKKLSELCNLRTTPGPTGQEARIHNIIKL